MNRELGLHLTLDLIINSEKYNNSNRFFHVSLSSINYQLPQMPESEDIFA